MAVIDDETLQMYIEESKEHLESIEADLLAIEQGGAAIDEELVNKVFRAAHSIKGGGGFLGLDNIKELSHKIENVLDLIRNYQLEPSSDVINIVLVAFDRLGELLDDSMNSNDMEIENHLIDLKNIVLGSLESDEKDSLDNLSEVSAPDSKAIFQVSQFDLNQANKGGNNLYIIKYDLIKDVQRKEKSPLDIMKSLDDCGLVLDINIGLDAVGDLDSDEIIPEMPLNVLFSSIIEDDLIGMLLGIEEDQITLVPRGEETSGSLIELIDEQVQQEHAAPVKQEVNVLEAAPEEEKREEKKIQPASRLADLKPRTQEILKSKKKIPVKTEEKTEEKNKKPATVESLRVSVPVLDQLMNRAGELVLARNELLQAIACGEKKAMQAAGQRVNQVTSELQEAIMMTRMQPVGNIFSKFTRVVRDLARDLGKEMEITLEGKDVELDKTIIEGLGDPLTHLVRNSCDHGIELPEIREQKGKPVKGEIFLRAFHESGQVIIEIEDDGKGLDCEKLSEKAINKGLITEEQAIAMSEKEKTALIMLPGFSTAEQVTDVSGRGVGMDVVKTNLDKLGGEVELISKVDQGTTVRIKLPLTLAIIPSLLVSSCGERFALPQVNVCELLRISAAEVHEKIEKVGGADVLILRGELIPLLQLNNVLGLQSTYYDPNTGEFRPDRRSTVADIRRSKDEDDLSVDDEKDLSASEVDERRGRPSSDVSIVVLQAGTFRFGLVVESVHDTVEIVVKPLGRHLKNNEIYAGATIMGDGNVALILDVAGLAKKAELRSISDRKKTSVKKQEDVMAGSTRQTLLLFHNGPEEYCAVPLHLVLRVEQIKTAAIEVKGGKKVIQYRGGTLPVFALEEVASVEMMEERPEVTVIIFVVAGREVGLLAIPPLDVVEEDLVLDEETLKQPGINASAIIRGKTTLMVDIFGFMQVLNPEWFEQRSSANLSSGNALRVGGGLPILLAEDSMFFRNQVKQFLESEGYSVVDFEDGKLAWTYLAAHPDDVCMVVTDIEMPNMDGFELSRKIKSDSRLSKLKVIALTSLAGEEDVAKGKECGIDEYLIKLDKEKLLQGIYKHLN